MTFVACDAGYRNCVSLGSGDASGGESIHACERVSRSDEVRFDWTVKGRFATAIRPIEIADRQSKARDFFAARFWRAPFGAWRLHSPSLDRELVA